MSSPSPKSLVPQIVTRSASSVSSKAAIQSPSNSDIMKLLTNLQSTQSDILTSNKNLADSQAAQFTDLKKCLEGLTQQVTELKLENTILHNKINILETRIASTENALSVIVQSSSPSSFANIPSICDITQEIHLRSLCARNIVIRGVPESLDPLASKRVTDDINFVQDIFHKLDPPLPSTSICKAFRIGKSRNSSPRILKVVLSSNDDVDRVITPFLRLRDTSPDQFTMVTISRDRTLSERQTIRETYNELRTRQDKGEKNISIRYSNGFPRIVPVSVTTRQMIKHKPQSNSKN